MNLVEALLPPSQTRRAVRIFLAALATLAAVWTFGAFGYEPCELCYRTLRLLRRRADRRADGLLSSRPRMGSRGRCSSCWRLSLSPTPASLSITSASSSAGGRVRAPAPGSLSGPVDVNDLTKALNAARVVNCDEVQLRILGLSLAGWDVVASAAMAIYAAFAARLAG